MVFNYILNYLILIIVLIAAVILFSILLRTKGLLRKAMLFLFTAVFFFVLVPLIRVINYSHILITNPYLHKVLELFMVISAAIGFYFLLKSVKKC